MSLMLAAAEAGLHPDVNRLLAFAIIVGVPAMIWVLPPVRRFVPAAVMFMLFGVLLGPSILGKISPDTFKFLFLADPSTAKLAPLDPGTNLLNEIKLLGFIAVTLFGFTTGLHLDISELRGKGKAFGTLSITSIASPFLLGMIAAAVLVAIFPQLLGKQDNHVLFIVAIGLSSGVTALPVLSAILSELRWIEKPIGKFALSLATFHDFVLWLVLAVLLAFTGSADKMSELQVGTIIRTFVFTIVYVVVMFAGIRPLLARAETSPRVQNLPEATRVTILVCLMFLSALTAEVIGIHSLLGAVLFGAIIPRHVAHNLGKMIEPLNLIIFLPFFFTSAGLRIFVSFNDPTIWVVLLTITSISMLGQIIGTAFVARRFFNFKPKTAFSLAALMQCKGIVEIVVLGLLFNAGVISDICYAAMVLMALLTTAITKPLVMFYTRVRTQPIENPPVPVLDTPSAQPAIRQVVA